MLRLASNPVRALQAFQLTRFTAMIAIGVGMARLGFSKTLIGNYEAVLFVSGLLTSFWITGLIQALLPLVSSNKQSHGFSYPDNRIFNAFLVVFLLTIVACGVALLFSNTVVGFTAAGNMHLFYLMLLYMLLSTPATMVEYVYLLHREHSAMLTYGMVTYVIQIAFVLLPVFGGGGVDYAILGLIGISAIRFIWLVLLIAKKTSFTLNVDFLRKYLRDGLPLSLKFLVSSSGLYIDQIIIGYYFDPSTFAVYRFGAREIPIVTILAVSLSNSLLANFGDKQKLVKNLEILKDESLKLMHLLFPISIAAILFARWLFPAIFGNEFSDSANIFMIYCLIAVSRVLLPQTVTQGLRENIAVLTISIVEMALNIILSLLLVTRFGIKGVAAATVIAYLFEKLLLMAYNRYHLNIKVDNYLPVRPYLVYTAITLLAFAIAWNFL